MKAPYEIARIPGVYVDLLDGKTPDLELIVDPEDLTISIYHSPDDAAVLHVSQIDAMISGLLRARMILNGE